MLGANSMNAALQQIYRTKTITALLILLIGGAALGAENKSDVPIDPIKSQLKILEERLEAVRRDQLNYKIEKDLLKDAYASNLETVNTVITIVLGIFAILGFLGVRSISSLRDQFKEELEKFRIQRLELEKKLTELESKQKEATHVLKVMTETNQQQDNRLKILEIQEKASSFIRQRGFDRALEYIAVGLDEAPGDIGLLRQKQECYFGLGRFENAVDVTEKIINLDSDSASAQGANLAELYLLLERFESHDEAVAQYRRYVEKQPYLSWYFRATRDYLNNDVEGLRERVEELINKLPAETKEHTDWRYDEARMVFSGRPDSPEKRLLFKAFDVLKGRAAKAELAEMLEGEASNSGSNPAADDSGS